MTPLLAAKPSADRRLLSPRPEQRAIPQLKLTILAPALIAANSAEAKTSALALGALVAWFPVSPKIGRNISVHAGQIAGAPKPRLPIKTPATNVP
jgi:hypothetical protein